MTGYMDGIFLVVVDISGCMEVLLLHQHTLVPVGTVGTVGRRLVVVPVPVGLVPVGLVPVPLVPVPLGLVPLGPVPLGLVPVLVGPVSLRPTVRPVVVGR